MSDPLSPIIDYYPVDFKIDLNGKKFAWQGVPLLPFVDENKLCEAIKRSYNQLTPDEKKRNIRGNDRLYVGPENKGYESLQALYTKAGSELKNLIENDKRYPFRSEGMRGDVMLSADNVCAGGQLPSPVAGLPPLLDNRVVCVRFLDPQYPKDFVFPSKRLKGAVDPPRVLKSDSLHEQNKDWRPWFDRRRRYQHNRGYNRYGYQSGSSRYYSSQNRFGSSQHWQRYNRYGNQTQGQRQGYSTDSPGNPGPSGQGSLDYSNPGPSGSNTQ